MGLMPFVLELRKALTEPLVDIEELVLVDSVGVVIVASSWMVEFCRYLLMSMDFNSLVE